VEWSSVAAIWATPRNLLIAELAFLPSVRPRLCDYDYKLLLHRSPSLILRTAPTPRSSTYLRDDHCSLAPLDKTSRALRNTTTRISAKPEDSCRPAQRSVAPLSQLLIICLRPTAYALRTSHSRLCPQEPSSGQCKYSPLLGIVHLPRERLRMHGCIDATIVHPPARESDFFPSLLAFSGRGLVAPLARG
jgi:hypothetical protein